MFLKSYFLAALALLALSGSLLGFEPEVSPAEIAGEPVYVAAAPMPPKDVAIDPPAVQAKLKPQSRPFFVPGEDLAIFDATESVAGTEKDSYNWQVVQTSGRPLSVPVDLTLSPDDTKRAYLTAPIGTTFRVYLFVSKDGHGDSTYQDVTWGTPTPSPSPGPNPGPGPGPTPSPIPDAGFRVLMMYDGKAGIPPIAFDPKLRKFLNDNAIKNSSNQSEWRMWDIALTDNDLTGESPIWQAAVKKFRTDSAQFPGKLPYLLVANGTTGYSGPAPVDKSGQPSVEDTIALLTKYLPKSSSPLSFQRNNYGR